MSTDSRLDRRLAEAVDAAPLPRPAGEDATVAAVVDQRRRRPQLPVVLAAAAILLLGLGLGFWLGRNGGEPAPAILEPDWAGRERRVFEEARTALGEDLAWLASAGGEITLALSAEQGDAELRVVALELRDETGRALARSRIVLPDGREADVHWAGSPHYRLRAMATEEGQIEVECSVDFDDGATLATSPRLLPVGAWKALGEVRTGGRTLALYALAD